MEYSILLADTKHELPTKNEPITLSKKIKPTSTFHWWRWIPDPNWQQKRTSFFKIVNFTKMVPDFKMVDGKISNSVIYDNYKLAIYKKTETAIY